MKTSSLMMCALVALTACGTGVKQSVRTPVEMGERIELKTPDPKMGPVSYTHLTLPTN